jgi:YD repeat-containing protein
LVGGDDRAEPNTTTNFSADPTTASAAPSPMKGWRYAYNDNGELVGTSDARGCGSNYIYDTGGRIVVEDYSPCVASQQTYSTPNPTTGDGAEVFYVYDAPDPAVPFQINGGTANECDVNAGLLLGRLVSVSTTAGVWSSCVTRRGDDGSEGSAGASGRERARWRVGR